jgi:hypothetical protein
MMFVPHSKHTHGPPRPITAIALLVYMLIFGPHRKHIHRPSRPVTEMILPFHMYLMFIPHRKHISRPPRPLIWIALILCVCVCVCMDDVPTSLETYVRNSTACYGIALPIYIGDVHSSEETHSGFHGLLRRQFIFASVINTMDRLCGLVVRVPGC